MASCYVQKKSRRKGLSGMNPCPSRDPPPPKLWSTSPMGKGIDPGHLPNLHSSNLKIHFLRQKGVDAALDFVETRPAPRSFVFAIGGPARARLAADGAVALVVQGVVGNFMIAEVLPDGFATPVGHRVELDDIAASGFVKGVNLEDADGGAGLGLLPAQAGDPAIQLGEFVAQRQNLSQRAAEVGVVLPEFRAVDVRLF